jgi:hypothetical protein
VLKEKETRLYGEYRTRRLVLEAWDRLEGVEPVPACTSPAAQQPPAPSNPPIMINTTSAPIPTTRDFALPVAPEGPARKDAQPSMIDFSVYRCLKCDKIVIGYDRNNHINEVHKGNEVEWKKIR